MQHKKFAIRIILTDYINNWIAHSHSTEKSLQIYTDLAMEQGV
jgi:hypothetical protein